MQTTQPTQLLNMLRALYYTKKNIIVKENAKSESRVLRAAKLLVYLLYR